MTDGGASGWLTTHFGITPDPDLLTEALTHGSTGEKRDYQRLEFLGDRVLGLLIAEWLYETFPDEPEGRLSHRLNILVSRESCAAIARDLGLGEHMVLGKQARDDGGRDSTNILGDVMESVIGAVFLTAGIEPCRAMVRAHWPALLERGAQSIKHPKSALQEWAAKHNRRPPEYRLVGKSGPHHSLTFTVEVEIANAGTAQAEGSSKAEAEKLAAEKLLGELA